MKIISMVILALLATPLVAGEIDVRGAPWNDLSLALGIKPYYVEIDSDQTAKSLGLVLEIYKQGKLVRTIATGACGFEKQVKLNVKYAIYFAPKTDAAQGYKLTCVQYWQGSSSVQQFDVPLSEIDMKKCRGSPPFLQKSGMRKRPRFFSWWVPWGMGA